MQDKLGNEIKPGDTLISDDGFSVIVTEREVGGWFGKLICDPDHSCANIPYALNEGRGYVVVRQAPASTAPTVPHA